MDEQTRKRKRRKGPWQERMEMMKSGQVAGLTALLDRQAPLMEEMHRRDGWNWQNRIDTVLSRMEFGDEDRRRPLHQLSGGWRNRAALAKILLEEPDVLLLDEPTSRATRYWC